MNTLQVLSPRFSCLGSKINQKMHPWSSDAISVKTMPPSGRAHPELHPIQVLGQCD